MLAAVSVTIAFADEVDFTGEWIVDGDDIGAAGIAGVINELSPTTVSQFRTLRETSIKSYDFTVISPGTIFDFVANGLNLTGSMLRQSTEEPIFNGKIDGNKISFIVRETVGKNTYSYSYTGELTGDSIQFDVKPPSNGGKRFQFKAKRVAP